jgi:hypothetical protein
MSAYSCKKWLAGDEPDAGYGETAYAVDTVQKLLPAGIYSYAQAVYQFPSAAAAASYYQENYAFSVRCATVTATVAGRTEHLTTQSLTRGHFGRYPAFTILQTLATTGELNGINDQLLTLVGNDVFDVEAAEPPSHALLTPNAAVRALITRVEAAG